MYYEGYRLLLYISWLTAVFVHVILFSGHCVNSYISQFKMEGENCSDGDGVDLVSATDTDDFNTVIGSCGVILCTVALIFALSSKFYKDIVQRVILIKLIVMILFSLTLILSFLSPEYYRDYIIYIVNGSFHKVLIHVHISYQARISLYWINCFLMFWLTVTLFLYIVCLKEVNGMRHLKLMIITFILIFGILVLLAVIVKFSSFICKYGYIFFFASLFFFGVVNLVTFVMTILILATVCKRSFARRSEDEAPLLVSNKWKKLLKELLPFSVYPIISTLLYLTFVTSLYSIEEDQLLLKYLSMDLSAPLTGTVVFIHVCILNQTKRKEKMRIANDEFIFNDEDVFTRDTVGATNAQTAYTFTRTSSIHVPMIPNAR